MEKIEGEERTQFQVDRIAFFSDAVIAIAITLLILEVKIPPLGAKTTLKDLAQHFSKHTGLSLMGMFVCFTAIGNLWVKHHELYRHVRNYNNRLVKVNLYFLATIMLLPLSISFTMDPDNPPFLTLPVFFLNLGLCYLTYFFMIQLIFSRKHRFADLPEKTKLKSIRRHAFAPAVIFLALALVTFLGLYKLFFAFFAYPVVTWFWSLREARKLRAAEKATATAEKATATAEKATATAEKATATAEKAAPAAQHPATQPPSAHHPAAHPHGGV